MKENNFVGKLFCFEQTVDQMMKKNTEYCVIEFNKFFKYMLCVISYKTT